MYALKKQENIVKAGNKDIIDEFTIILNDMAEEVTPIIDRISTQEIESVLQISDEVLVSQIIAIIQHINSNTDKVINEVTLDTNIFITS